MEIMMLGLLVVLVAATWLFFKLTAALEKRG
jgi:hypothetical protein